MEMWNTVMGLLQKGAIAAGGMMIIWGAITLGNGIKDHTGPEINKGLWTIIGGTIITIAGAFFSQIKM